MELNAEEIRDKTKTRWLYNLVQGCTEYMFKMEMGKKKHF